MQISALRSETSEALRGFVWDQWAQLGAMASARRHDRWAADPEALILLTLEVGRDEPRLFDELLDWLLVNERLVSVQRARNLAVDVEDRALLDATIAWLAHERGRRPASSPPQRSAADAAPLFRTTTTRIEQPDETFLAHGWRRARVQPRRHSQPVDLQQPIAFALRLRQILGVSARAEVVRTLLTVEAPRLRVKAIGEAAGYAKRNVQEALSSLYAAGVVDEVGIATERQYSAPRARWAGLLGLEEDDLPLHRDWPQLFLAMRRILRWLDDPAHEQQSDYMRASDARDVMTTTAPLLRYAGIDAREDGAHGADYWTQFADTITAATASLG